MWERKGRLLMKVITYAAAASHDATSRPLPEYKGRPSWLAFRLVLCCLLIFGAL